MFSVSQKNAQIWYRERFEGNEEITCEDYYMLISKTPEKYM